MKEEIKTEIEECEDMSWWQIVGAIFLLVFLIMVGIMFLIIFANFFLDVLDMTIKNIENFRIKFPYVHDLFN